MVLFILAFFIVFLIGIGNLASSLGTDLVQMMDCTWS